MRLPGPSPNSRKIQIRLRHRYRDGTGAQGARRRHGAIHLGQEGRAGMDAGMASRPRSAAGGRCRSPTWARVHYPRDRLSELLLLRGAERCAQARQPRRCRSRNCSRPTRSSAFRSTNRKCWPGVAVDAVFDSVSVATTFKGKLERGGRHFLPDFRSGPRASRSGAKISGLRGAGHRTISSPR